MIRRSAVWPAVLLLGWFLIDPGGRGIALAQFGPAGVTDGLAPVAKGAMRAVVNISSSRTVRGSRSAPPSPFFSDPFFRFFFEGPEMVPRRERSLGSGVIVTPDGTVLTNSHVVAGADEIRLTLPDRRELEARLVGADPRTDVAVLKLAGTGFPTVPLGDSDRVEVAEVVLAIGNPFGLGQTVTMGIVSAVGRANIGIADYEDFIQTDAAINPGNSGGALVNVRGELIGINTAIATESGGATGIGFAVPMNMARQVMEQLVKHGRVRRGFIGLTMQDLTPALARGLALGEGQGAVVVDVVARSPAARAGIRRGDVIVAFDDKPVGDAGHLRNVVATASPGARVRLTVRRAGREQTMDVVLEELAEPEPVRAAPSAPPGSLGISVVDLTPELTRRLGLPRVEPGVVVIKIEPGSLADEVGLRAGDVIHEINRQPVRSPRDFRDAVDRAKGKSLALLVNRRGVMAYVVIERAG